MQKMSAIKLLCSCLLLCSLCFSLGWARSESPNPGVEAATNGLFQVSFSDNLFCAGQNLGITVNGSVFAPEGSVYTFYTQLENMNGVGLSTLAPVTTPTVPFTYQFPLTPPPGMYGSFRVRISAQLAVGATGPVLDLGTVIDYVTVNRAPVLNIDFSGYTASCQPKIIVSGTGGSGMYRYSLDGYNFFPDTYSGGSYSFNNLPSGSYLARLRDSKGCEAYANTQISPIHATPSVEVKNITSDGAFLNIGPITGNSVYDIRYRTSLGGSGYQDANVDWMVISDLDFQTMPPNSYLYFLDSLQGCTKYEVQVRAKCGPGFSEVPWDVEHAKFFTTICQGGVQNCPTPQTVYVANNVVYWDASTDVVCYTVAMGPANTPPSSWSQYVISHNPFAPAVGDPQPLDLQYFSFPPNLQPNMNYRVHVRANCQYCSNLMGTFSDWSTQVRFKTKAKMGMRDGDGVEVVDAERVTNLVGVYPNPSKGLFTLTVDVENGGVGTLRMTDLLGQTILEKNLSTRSGANQFDVDLTSQPAGIYLLNYTQGTVSQTMKVIVK